MTARSHWLLFVVALALPGCLYSGGWSSSGSSPAWGSTSIGTPTYGYGGGLLDVQAGHQTGAMGEILSYDGDATRMQGRRDSPTSSYVQLDSIGTGWWVMTGLNFNTDIDTMMPGQTYYAESLYGTPPPGGSTSGMSPVSVSVTGCSGPSDGNYTYDRQAVSATFQVEELPSGLRRVHYDCGFEVDAGMQHATGYFDYAPVTTSTTPLGPGVQVNEI